MGRVGVIGGGPSGLVMARYLKSEGFTPVLFEQGANIGGQWSGEPGHSGVWPSMRTNTSRILTAFSDLSHAAGSPTYPTNQAMAAYLERYAEMFDLKPHVRLNTRVDEIRRDGADWVIRATGPSGKAEERFEKVVVATGRYNKPLIPAVPGLDSFTGKGGVTHTFGYKHPESYRGLRVVVGGCAISALEIATDLVMLGADVTVTQRRQRYVLPKLVQGVPTDHLAFTRFAAMADETFPLAAIAAGLKQFVLGAGGSPEQYGAPKPADNVFEAGITLSQYFLPMVAEGRIAVKPWMAEVKGTTVRFADSTEKQADALIFGTGFALHLPFLSNEIRATLDLDEHHIDLDRYTFHPDLPGLAFLGLYEQVGPYFPSLEPQARWIAYTFGGSVPAPSREQMEAGVAAYRKGRGGPQLTSTHGNAIRFSRAAGIEPDLIQWPQLARALMFGPLVPVSFRLNGRDALPGAEKRFSEEIRAFGCMTSDEFTPQQMGKLQALANAGTSASFKSFVARIAASSKTETAGR